ncbi:hypothetical protein BTH42_11805 [Burkholderia sp. SRS-W-2-2016]|nr:hypothetical protein BTH42_11805 [Burkholderia sp. SRS-W-2-2016]
MFFTFMDLPLLFDISALGNVVDLLMAAIGFAVSRRLVSFCRDVNHSVNSVKSRVNHRERQRKPGVCDAMRIS